MIKSSSRLLAALKSTTNRISTLPSPVPDTHDLLHDPAYIKQNLIDRRYPIQPQQIDDYLTLNSSHLLLQQEILLLKQQRNQLTSPSSGSSSTSTTTSAASTIKAELKRCQPQLALLTQQLHSLALLLPNTSHPSSPVGNEDKAKVIATYGPPIADSPLPAPDPARDHLLLSGPAQLGWTDFPTASLVTGSSWPYLLKEGALLEIALTNYAIHTAIRKGFSPVLTPDVVKYDIAERCGFKPREGEAAQTYYLSTGEKKERENELCLTGTAEIPLVAMSAGTIINFNQLPLKHVALGKAFRAEAGARGAESRGLYRVHQFSKVEMVVVCAEEQSDKMLEELRKVQEEILGALGLSLRVLEMPTQELGASAHRKYDIEAWMPGRGKWGELSSASNCTSYQSRRLSIRYRPSTSTRAPFEDLDIPTPAALEATALYPSAFSPRNSTPKLVYAHTLNATAAAIPRLIIAILENGAVLDSEQRIVRVRIPEVLKKFWIGDEQSTVIEWVKKGEALRQ